MVVVVIVIVIIVIVIWILPQSYKVDEACQNVPNLQVSETHRR